MGRFRSIRARQFGMSVALVLLLNALATAPALAAPTNDTFENAMLIGSLPYQDYRMGTGAGLDIGEPAPACDGGVANATVWYRYDVLAAPSSPINVSTYIGDNDSILNIYKSTASYGVGLTDLTKVTCNDNSGGPWSEVTFTATANTTYFIQLGVVSLNPGWMTLNMGFAPSHDEKSGAKTVLLPYTDDVSTIGATTAATDDVPCGFAGSTVWYKFTAVADTQVTVDTSGSSFDTVVHAIIFDASGTAMMIECNDNASSSVTYSRRSFSAPATHTLYIQVGGTGRRQGSLKLSITQAQVEPNDDYADATAVTLPFQSQMNGPAATRQLYEPAPCNMGPESVWYSYTPSTAMTVNAHTRGSDVDSVLVIYTGSVLQTLSFITCNDDLNWGDTDSYKSWNLTAGTTYYFQVGRKAGTTFGSKLIFDLREPSDNDNFSNAIEIPALPATHVYDNSLHTMQTSEPTTCVTQRSSWLEFTPSADTRVTINGSGSSTKPQIGVFTGSSLSTLSSKGCATSGLITFLAEASTTYYIQIGGSAQTTEISLTGILMPPGDLFSKAVTLGALPVTHAANLQNASTETSEPSCHSSGTVWLKATLPSGSYTADTFGTGTDTGLGVYTGSALSSLTQLGCSDDWGGDTLESSASFILSASTTVYFQLSGDGAAAMFHLSQDQAPANDNFTNATVLSSTNTATSTLTLRSTLATTEASEPTYGTCATRTNTVWYKITTTTATVISVDPAAGNFPTGVEILEGSTLTGLTLRACGDDTAITYRAAANTTYYVRAGSYTASSGTMRLVIRTDHIPHNDDLVNAIEISTLPFSDDRTTWMASTQSGELSPHTTRSECGEIARTVWYRYTPVTNTVISLDSFDSEEPSGSHFNTVAAVYRAPHPTSTFGDFSLVDCNNDHSFRPFKSSVAVEAREGSSYFIQVGGLVSSGGNLSTRIRNVLPLTSRNDLSRDPLVLTDEFLQAGSYLVASETFSSAHTATVATLEPSEKRDCAQIGATIWFEFTSTSPFDFTTSVILDAVDRYYTSAVAVYLGSPTGTQVACSTPDGMRNQTTFPMAGGQKYYIQVGGYRGDSGAFRLRLIPPSEYFQTRAP